MKEPTAKQLAYLKDLGYDRSPPLTIVDASNLIDSMKDGLSAIEAEKGMIYERATGVEKVKLYLNGIRERKENGYVIAGFRVKIPVEFQSESNKAYSGAFIPYDVACKYPEIIAACGVDQVDYIQRKPQHGPIVMAPNQVEDIAQQKETSVSKTGAPAQPKTQNKSVALPPHPIERTIKTTPARDAKTSVPQPRANVSNQQKRKSGPSLSFLVVLVVVLVGGSILVWYVVKNFR